jgi:cell division protein FtsB
MKRSVFALVFVGTHIIFVVLQIHRHTQYIQYSYQKQKNEKMYENLLKEQEMLAYELHTLHNNETIKEYAHNTLGMVATNLQHIKRIADEN